MKNLTFNFKSIVQTKARWLLTFCALLTIGVGQMWAGSEYTVYVAPAELWGNDWNDGTKYVQLNFCPSYSNGNPYWWTNTMTWTGAYNSNGNKIYKHKFTDVENGTHGLQFLRKRNSDNAQEHCYSYLDESHSGSGGSWTSSWQPKANYADKVYWGYSSNAHQWTSYSTYAVTLVGAGYIYFDNTNNILSSTYKYFVVGHGSYSKVYALSPLDATHTNILYVYLNNEDWKDANYCAFISTTGTWGNGNWGTENLTNAASYTGTLSIDFTNNRIASGKYYLFNGTSSTLSRTEGNTVDAVLNPDQTIDVKISTNRGVSYTDDASWTSGFARANRYYASAYNTVSNASSTALSSSTTSTPAIKTSTITFTGVANEGYTFKGWNTSSSAPDGNGSGNKAYTVTGTTTTYAFFERNHYTLTYSPASPIEGTHHFTWYTKPSDADYGITVTFKITPASGYEMAVGYPTVTYGGGTSVSVSPTANANEYSFTMPDAAPTITVSMVASAVPVHVGIYDGTAHGTIKAGSESAVRVDADYNVTYNSSVTFTANPDDGYEVQEWYLNGVAQSNTNTTFTPANITTETTVKVSYKPITYSITYNNMPDGSVNSNPTSYNIESSAITLVAPTLAGGYFKGWFTDEDLAAGNAVGTPAIAAGSIGNKTFYAKWMRITGWAFDPDATNFAANTTIEATPTIINTDAIDYVRCWTLYDEDGETEILLQPEFSDDGSSVSFAIAASGSYKLRLDLKAVGNNCSDESLVYGLSDVFSVQTNNIVTISYQSDGVDLLSKTTVQASENSLTPEVDAPDITGYAFHHWEKSSNVTIATGTQGSDGSAGTTPITINASANGTLTAVYKTAGLYFKNTLGWEHVYICMHNNAGYWNSNGSGSKSKTFAEMSKIKDDPTGDIYFYETSFTNGHSVAFVNMNQSDEDNFKDGAEVVYRFINDAIPMCIPVKNNSMDYKTINGAHYVRSFWAKYNPSATGYELKLYNQKTISGATLEAAVPFKYSDNGMQITAIVNLESNKNLGFRFTQTRTGGEDAGKWQWWRNNNNSTMTYSSSMDWVFWDSNSAYNCGLDTKAAGDYKFIISSVAVSDADKEKEVQGAYCVSVVYPCKDGDYRLVYREGVQNYSSPNTQRSATWYHETDLISKGDGETTVQVYIDADATPSLTLQKYTISTNTWADVTPANTADLSGITGGSGTGSGVYNFTVTQTNNGATVTIANAGKYTGNFYIRTNGVNDDKWDYKRSPEAHRMHYSEYSANLTNNPYSHYYVKDLESGTNVRYTVATENSSAITDTLFDKDADFDLGAETLPSFANVRFMYNQNTNRIKRTFIGASTNNNFLNLRGLHSEAKLFKSWTSAEENTPLANAALADDSSIDVDTLQFKDNGNWIYEADIYAIPGATYKLTATYNSKTQFFKGKAGAYATEGNTEQLIGGTGSKAYPIRMIYDFKTNQLTTAWLPSDLASDLDIKADVMLIREHQGAAEQISLNGFKLQNVKKVYGVMKLNKWILNNRYRTGEHEVVNGNDYQSRYERGLYWISFPFEVKLSDVFGFGEYGTHWIIEYYDGKGRAEHGFWADSPSNWKFVMPEDKDTYILEANVGYILALDLDLMGESNTDVWQYNEMENVELYFPSRTDVGTIENTNVPVAIKQDGYQCTIGPRFEGGDDRRVKDSYWHCIGVPSYANKTRTDATTSDPTSSSPESDASHWVDELWLPNGLLYFYNWNPLDNTLEVEKTSSSVTFNAMHSYMVQYSGTTLTWTSVANVAPKGIAARVEETPDREYKLSLLREDEEQDHTYVRLTDDASVSNRFEFNYDLSKEYNAGRGNIWTVTADTVEVAGNSMPKPVQTTVVPVGVKVVANGEYTFSMPEGTNGENVVLIDNAYGTRTNLGLMPYTVTLTAGTYDSRFALEFGPIQDAPTGIEQMSTVNYQLSTEEVRKVFVGGRLYIIRDGKVYDAAGQRVE